MSIICLKTNYYIRSLKTLDEQIYITSNEIVVIEEDASNEEEVVFENSAVRHSLLKIKSIRLTF